MTDFHVSGTLINKLDEGHTVRDATSEKTDNSWDWGATVVDIKINTNTKEMMTIDDAVGMNKSGLEGSVVLNKRSEASNEKQGKYGAGLPHAMMVDTRLNGSVQIISKKEGMPEVLSINVDLKECVEKGIYSNKANEASVKQDRLYREHVRGDHGTLIIEDCDEQVIHELVAGFKSVKIIDSLIYDLGVKYAQYLKQGKKIRIEIDDDYSRDVIPIDPLCLDVVTPDYQKVQCDVYEYGLNIVVACNNNGKMQKVKTAKNNANHWNDFVLEEGMKLVASFQVESVYRPEEEWLRIQNDIVSEIEGYSTESEMNEDCSETNSEMTEERKNKDQKKYAHMGGLYLNRNLKNIHRETIEKPNSGDKASYDYCTDSRYRVTFPVELDKLFGVQVNKSHIKYENIDTEIVKTIEKIEYSFYNNKYKEYRVPPTTEEIEAKQKEKEAKQKEKETMQKEKDTKKKEKEAKKNKKISNQAVAIVVEKVDEVIVEKVLEKVDEVIVEKVLEKVDEVIVENVVEKVLEKVDEVIVEKVLEKVDEVIVEDVNDNREIVIKMTIEDTEVVIETANNNSEVAIENVEEVIGKTRSMKGSEHTRLTVGQALGLINSNKLSEEVIDRIMPKYFDRCAPDQFWVIYNYLSMEQKKNMLKEMIENKYRGIYEADVLGGAEILLSLV
jgi:hypothetical protein